MKKVITTVGTSIFTNLTRDGRNSDIQRQYKSLESSTYTHDKWIDKVVQEIIEGKKGLSQTLGLRKTVFNEIKNSTNASAEIKSILKIAEEVGADIEVYLLATDTCELIEAWFKNHADISVFFNHQQDVIKDLQINNAQAFKTGLINLNNRFRKIAENEILAQQSKNIILNITGGYKGVIPFLTILGQINQCQIKYIFEETETLISIPQIPIKLDEDLFEKYWQELELLEQQVILNKNQYYQMVQDLESCFEFENQNDFSFNFLGIALWEKYKSKFFTFYCSDKIMDDINQHTEVKDTLISKFSIREKRENKVGPKLTHKTVYDDGNNSIRIFFVEQKENIFIYKVFGNGEYDNYDYFWRHEAYNDAMLKDTKLRRLQIINA